MNQHPSYLHSELTGEINAAAIAVHKELGPGFLEEVYEKALCVEFDRRRLAYQRQLPVHVRYQGVEVGLYRLDLVVNRKVVVEVKAVEAIHEVHLAVALAYLKATGLAVGLVINFAGSIMRCRRVFRPEHWTDNEGMKERIAEAATPPVNNGILLPSTFGHMEVTDDDKLTLQGPQLGRLQSEPDQSRKSDDLV